MGRPALRVSTRCAGSATCPRSEVCTRRCGSVDHIRYLARLHGLTPDAASTATDRWLEQLGVSERSRDKVEALSLGNQQRVQLAAALVHEPDLLVLDEPFSGLDPVGVEDLAGVLAERAAAGATVLFSSHQLDLVEDLCESVAIINRGRLVASGAVRDLIRGEQPRLVVEVADDPTGAWAGELSGVEVVGQERGRVSMLLRGAAAPDVLAAAMAHGEVAHFAYEARRLSEVFRDAMEQEVAA